jgi:ribosomal protein S13
MFIFKDINLNVKTNLRFVFCKIFGIGVYRAFYLADLIGLGFHFFMGHANYYIFELFNTALKKYFSLDEHLEFLIKRRIIHLYEIKTRRGIRFYRALPLRGQRTHTNTKQSKYHRRNIIVEYLSEKEEADLLKTKKNNK